MRPVGRRSTGRLRPSGDVVRAFDRGQRHVRQNRGIASVETPRGNYSPPFTAKHAVGAVGREGTHAELAPRSELSPCIADRVHALARHGRPAVYPAQQGSVATFLVKDWAASFSPSTMVR